MSKKHQVLVTEVRYEKDLTPEGLRAVLKGAKQLIRDHGGGEVYSQRSMTRGSDYLSDHDVDLLRADPHDLQEKQRRIMCSWEEAKKALEAGFAELREEFKYRTITGGLIHQIRSRLMGIMLNLSEYPPPRQVSVRQSLEDPASLSVDVAKYQHDCDKCRYLGQYVFDNGDTVDLYYHEEGGFSPTILVRWSSDLGDYSVLPESVVGPELMLEPHHLPLAPAFREARRRLIHEGEMAP